ncbi:MAG TPA: hypothetical protein PKM73_07565 [Verrucomicrobiota bacterium]|nr:hypothetical protein [Verrucomicrobiota bacterium]
MFFVLFEAGFDFQLAADLVTVPPVEDFPVAQHNRHLQPVPADVLGQQFDLVWQHRGEEKVALVLLVVARLGDNREVAPCVCGFVFTVGRVRCSDLFRTVIICHILICVYCDLETKSPPAD